MPKPIIPIEKKTKKKPKAINKVYFGKNKEYQIRLEKAPFPHEILSMLKKMKVTPKSSLKEWRTAYLAIGKEYTGGVFGGIYKGGKKVKATGAELILAGEAIVKAARKQEYLTKKKITKLK